MKASCVLFTAILVAATCAKAQAPAVPLASSASAAANPLEPYGFLAGGTWTADVQMGNEPGTYAVEYTFEWVLNGKFLQSRHVTKREGKALSSTLSMIGWDAERKSVAQWGFNNMGMTAVLHAQPAPDSGSFAFEGKLGSSEKAPTVRTTYRPRGPDELEIKTKFLRDGKYTTAGTVTLRRK